MSHPNYLAEQEMVGKVFGRLTVQRRSANPKRKRERYWDCICSCPNATLTTVSTNKLTSGHTQSCGCYADEVRGKSSKKYNNYDLSGVCAIGFIDDKTIFYFDIEDYDKIKNYYWAIDDNGYIRSSKSINNKSKRIYLHRIILGLKDNDHLKADHANRLKYDNRKSNLRLATNSQNSANQKVSKNNTSGFLGIFLDKRSKKWCAKIKKNRKDHFLGYFEDLDDAVFARLKAEKELFGEFSPQQHLFKQYGL